MPPRGTKSSKQKSNTVKVQPPQQSSSPSLPPAQSIQLPRSHHIEPKQLTLHLSRIKLNSTQTHQIQLINDQLQALSQIEAPDRYAFNTELRKKEIEINQLFEEIRAIKNQISLINQELRDHKDQNSPVLMTKRSLQDELDELFRERSEKRSELGILREKKRSHETILHEVKRKYGIMTLKEGSSRVEEIDAIIERETLTNSQLKKLLAEKDRTRAGMKYLSQLPVEDSFSDDLTKDETQILDELQEINDEIDELIAERSKLQTSTSFVSAEFQRKRDQKKAYIDHLDKLQSEVDMKFEEKRRLIEDFERQKSEYEGIEEAKRNLEYEKSVIYGEAEVETLKEYHEHQEMKVAQSLIDYLGKIEREHNGNHGAIGKSRNRAEELELIAQLRKPTKKERQMAKRRDVKKIGEFVFDEEIQKQFKIIDIPIPGSIEDISMTLQLLQEKATRSQKPESIAKIEVGSIDEIDGLSPSI
jgi:chromosome segregation ATPase